MVSVDQAFIEARQDRYRIAHNNLDVEKFLKWFADEVDYSDHGLGVAHINKEALEGLARSVFASVSKLVFETVSVNGTKEFTAWEWTAKGTVSKEIPGFPFGVGDDFNMVGCSLFWWDTKKAKEGEDAKLTAVAEYSKM